MSHPAIGAVKPTAIGHGVISSPVSGRSAEHLLEEERQRDAGQVCALNEQIEPTTESANTGRAKSSSASIGVCQQALPPDEECACYSGARQLECDDCGQSAKIVDADDERAKGCRAQQGAEPIETMTGERVRGSARLANTRAMTPRGTLIQEEPLPRRDRQNSGLYTRPDRCRGRSDHGASDRDSPAELVGGINEAEQGHVDAHDPGTAKTLEDARGDERGQRPGERVDERAEREHGQTRDEDAPVAAQLAERAECQKRDRHGELIGVDHPDGIRRVRAKLGGDGRQRDVGDGAIEYRILKAGQDDEYRPPPLGLR